jgi:hypothetical protein
MDTRRHALHISADDKTLKYQPLALAFDSNSIIHSLENNIQHIASFSAMI